MAENYTVYPDDIDSASQLPVAVDNVTPVKAEVVNRLRSAILAVESELGIQPSSTYTTVRARLDALEAVLDSLGGSITSLGLSAVLTIGNETDGHDIIISNGNSLVNEAGTVSISGHVYSNAISFPELAANPLPVVSGKGTLWLKNTNVLVYTDDSGTDHDLLTGAETLAATLALGNSTGGNNIEITNGDEIVGEPGVGAGSGGVISVTGGTGGSTGVGGSLLFSGGSGGSSSGNGGSITFQGGQTNDGNGGSISIIGNNGVGSNKSGGNVTITAGNSTGTVDGANITLTPGISGGSGSDGIIYLDGYVNATGNIIGNVATPVNSGDAVNKAYVDNIAIVAPVQNWTSFINLVNAQAALGNAVQMAPGTWTCDAKVDLDNGAHIIAGQGVLVHCVLTYGGVDPFNAPFEAGPVASGINTTLAAIAVVGGMTVLSNGIYSVGSYISIQTTSLRRQYYEVKNVSGVGPYTLTLDRPIREPYPNGATVMGWTSIVKNIRIEGRGMKITGTADRYVEIAGAWDCDVSGIQTNTSDGYLGSGSIALSYDIGCLRCVFRDIYVDSTDHSISGGVIIESGERCLIERCNVENIGTTASTGVALYDSWDSQLIDCHAWGAYYGAAFTGNGGEYGCAIRGGSYWNNTYGIIVGNGTRSLIDDVDCVANTSAGIYLAAELNPTVSNVRCQGNAIDIDIGANCTGTRMSNIYLSGGTTRNLYIRPGSGKTVDVHGLRIYVPATNGTTFILVDSGDLRIYGLDIDDTPANRGVTTLWVAGGSMSINGGTLALGSATHGIYNASTGVVRLHDVTITGVTNGYTGVAASGGTLRMSGRCDLSTNIGAGAYSNIGTVQLNGASAVDVTWPDLKANDTVMLTLQTAAGVQGLAPTCTKTLGTKFTVTGIALDTSTYVYRVS